KTKRQFFRQNASFIGESDMSGPAAAIKRHEAPTSQPVSEAPKPAANDNNDAAQLTAHYNSLVGQIGRSKFDGAVVLPQLGHVLSAHLSRITGNADYLSGKMSAADMQKQLLLLVPEITK